ncbi:MAG: hypothetical protein LH477_12370, partial [Nocardioides sp.]|nr:hypothetical protein [Nocardioides sp.]
AGRAAAAAQRAREARAFAAQAAAQSVALEAERTATRVQARADLAAEQVQVAACWLRTSSPVVSRSAPRSMPDRWPR